MLFELGFGDLPALAGRAAGVPEVVAGGLQHEELEAVQFVVRSDDFSRSEGADCVVESVGVEVEGEAIAERTSRDRHREILEELAGLIPGIGHQMPSIWDLTTDDHANASIHVVNPLIGVIHKQLREDLLLRAEHNAVLALNTNDGPEWKEEYSAL